MIRLLLILALSLLALPCFAQKRLEGSVQHSEQLAPLDESLRPGKVFDPSKLTDRTVKYEWYRIPNWLAGLWYTQSETVKGVDLRNGLINPPQERKRSDKHLFGMQMDAQGSIWHCIVLPRKHVVASDPITEDRLETTRDFFMTQPDEVITTYRFTAVQVNNSSHRIVQTHQQESILHLRPLDNDRLQVRGSLKTFDFDGRPMFQGASFMTFYRSRPFVELPTYRDADMRQLFKQYLIAHNLPNLVPHY